MIQPLQFNSNLNFKGNEVSPALKARMEAQALTTQENSNEIIQEQPKEKFSIANTYQKTKKGVTNVIKKVNSFIGVSGGVTKGIIGGGLTAGAIGVVGKNIKNAKGQIGATLMGLGKDIITVTKTTLKAIPCIITKSPLDNVKSLGKSALTGVKTVLKGVKNHKLTAVIAAVSAITIFAASTIKGKVDANKKNSELDHITNQGHV